MDEATRSISIFRNSGFRLTATERPVFGNFTLISTKKKPTDNQIKLNLGRITSLQPCNGKLPIIKFNDEDPEKPIVTNVLVADGTEIIIDTVQSYYVKENINEVEDIIHEAYNYYDT